MAEYYLISQLPSLDGVGEETPLPITEQRFLELCKSLLGKKAQSEMEKLTLLPTKSHDKSGSPLIEAWNEGERNLRFALSKVRADKMKKSSPIQDDFLPTELIKVANAAVEIDNPLKAEKFLNRYRLEFLETLRPSDTFAEDFIYYYGLKLKLLLYIKQFNTELGEAAYKNIYNSILNGDRVEVI